MNLTKVSAVAEILSSIAVVFTLVLLLIGVKENTEMTRVAAYQSSMEEVNSWRNDLTSDPLKTELYLRYLQGELPTERPEMLILSMMVDSQHTNQEVAFFQYDAGMMGDLEWEKLLNGVCNAHELLTSIGGQFMDATRSRMTTPFKNYIDETC